MLQIREGDEILEGQSSSGSADTSCIAQCFLAEIWHP